MSDKYRENYAALCNAIRSGEAAMLECRDIESGAMMVVVCSTQLLPDGHTEFFPLARIVDYTVGSVILPTALDPEALKSSKDKSIS